LSKKDPVEFTAELKHETDNAYLVNNGDEDIWIPKSQCEKFEKISGDHYEIIIPEWLAEAKGII
jgi:hypothetical protein